MLNRKSKTQTFWKIVDEFKWDEICKKYDDDFPQVLFHGKCFKYDLPLSEAEEIFHRLQRKLYNKIINRSKGQWRVEVKYYSDDGAGDCTAHIVGLGKEKYEEFLSDTQKIVDFYNDHKYQESFAYMFLPVENKEDWPGLKTKDLIEALADFDPESSPIAVFTTQADKKFYGSTMEGIEYVSNNNGHPQLNLDSFAERMKNED